MFFLGNVIPVTAGGVTAIALPGLEWAAGRLHLGKNGREMLASLKLSLWTKDQLLEGAEEGYFLCATILEKS